jgi:two-component system sensor histidine kinase RegB
MALRKTTAPDLHATAARTAHATGMADLEPTVTLPWLVRLRWLFLAGQLVLFPIAQWGFAVHLEWWALILALGVAAISNVAIAKLHARKTWPSASLMGGVLVLDTALLTLLLGASGGSMNPFTVFYLVYVTLSAVVLSARWTISIGVLSLIGFGLLFVVAHDLGMHMHGGTVSFSRHLQSMWLAYALAAALVTFFIGKITRAIAVQRDQIASLREANARNARLAGLTTLAAGAAHELGSPLATIEVAAHEAALGAGKLAGAGAIASDLALILLEVDRCQGILHQMAARATQPDDVAPLTVAELATQVCRLLGGERSQRVELETSGDRAAFALPAEQMAQAIAALIKNALEASAPSTMVSVTMSHARDDVHVTIEDRGAGIPADVLARVGEPFFTTKQPGHGMGLGVFLARAFVESRGGALVIESNPGLGTRARVRLPAEPAA